MQRASRILAISLVAACSSAQVDPEANQQASKIDEYISSLPYLQVDAPAVTAGARSAEEREGDYACTTQSLKETRQYDRIVAYAANSDSMYPGAVIGADSVVSGLFTQI